MKAGAPTSPNARCLSCGYLLRGLPQPVCPECARPFDPADPTTFDADPPGRRRRRLVIRGAVLLTVVAVAAAMFPRGILKADVTLTCTRCNRSLCVTRWQLNPPSWVPFAYPGVSSRTDSTAGSAATALTKCDHQYDYLIRSDLPIGGSVKGWGSVKPRDPTTINGVPLSPDTGSQVLRALLKPGNNGIGP